MFFGAGRPPRRRRCRYVENQAPAAATGPLCRLGSDRRHRMRALTDQHLSKVGHNGDIVVDGAEDNLILAFAFGRYYPPELRVEFRCYTDS